MKSFLLIICLISFNTYSDIDNDSFANKDKFTMLSDSSIGQSETINLDVTFNPPTGKKVNHASYVKVYEKNKKKWVLSEVLEIQNAFEEFDGKVLTHNAILNHKNTELAVEIDFIHCNYNGGQCDQERYLGKIKRDTKNKSNKVKYTLNLDKNKK